MGPVSSTRDPAAPAQALATVRLDVFLDVACLLPTRSQATKACAANHVEVNGAVAKPNKLVRVGDEIVLKSAHGRRTFVIQALCERHIAKAEARKLIEETTPKPSPEELELRRLTRAVRVLRPAGAGRPTKRERRAIDKLKDP